MDKSRFHNIRQLAEELTRYGIIYKLIDDLDIYDKPDIFDKYVRWLKTPKKFQNIINLNVKSVFNCIQEAVKIMKSNINQDFIDRIIMGISTYNQDAESVVDKIFLSR